LLRSDSSFDDLISFLTQQYHGNIHDVDAISVTLTGANWTHNANAPNSWICYDLNEKRMSLSHYSLHSRPNSDGWHAIHWTLEGSMDGSHWIRLDHRDSCRELLGANRFAVFEVSRRESVRQIWIRQHGKDSSEDGHLAVSAFESVGDVSDI
jgi:hypothetical protein